MTWGKSVLLTIPLVLSGIFVVASPASAKDFSATDWKSVSAGGSHACAITNSGYLYCWGNDDSGQLGNSSVLNGKTTPNQVGSSSGWTAVSAGGSHTCGIRNGKLYCWGSDEFGQLGNGTARDDRATPGDAISGATDWVAITTGTTHTCALRNISGRGRMLACWGDDSHGQIGNGSKPSPTVPAFVSGAIDWQTITAGGFHTCGIRANKPKGPMLACWGNDEFGQVGNGPLGEPSVPAQVSYAYDWQTVSAGETHTCGIRAGGMLACWGSDSHGQIGNGGGVGAGPSVPSQVAKTLPTDWKSVSAGGAHTCAIRTSSNKLYCWGDNQYGQSVATSDDALYTTPQEYLSTSWKAQDTGHRHTCAIKSDGTLNCWGVLEPPPPNDCPTPAANVYAGDPWQDLRYWKLTTPVDGSDSNSTADEVKQPALKTLDGKDYFDRLSVTDNPILFRARVDGATTSGSSFPRSELREMTQDGQYNRAAWYSQCGTHQMTITEAITHQPIRTDPKDPVVAGQIHDGGVDGGHGDVAMVRLEGTRLFVEADGVDRGTLDSNYQLGQKFTVTLTATEGKFSVQYDSASNPSVTVGPFSPAVDNKQWFFKAGCYTQDNVGDPSSEYGEVIIYDLAVTHS